MATLKPCTVGPKHKWEWVTDTTVKTSPSPGMVRFSRKGVYKCACGLRKYGMARSGL